MLCYAIRHAESVVNAGIGTGVDAGLSPLGMRQAESVARRLRDAGLVAVYSSPYRRALQTAEPLARALGLPIRVRFELCEFGTGGPYGTDGLVPPTWESIAAICSVAGRDPDDDNSIAFPALDESVSQVIARALRFATFLKQRWTGPDDAVVAFGHGMPLARFIDAWTTDQPGPSFRFVVDNAALAALRYSGGVNSMVCMNEVSHLSHLEPPAGSNYAAGWSVKPRPPSNYW